jgi:membrane-associated phospholipid phosphatase
MILDKKAKVTLLLVMVFLVNYMETGIETWLMSKYGIGAKSGHLITVAFQQFENNYTFDNHDATSLLAVYGYSISYFFVLPVLGLLVAVSLAITKTLSSFRVFGMAVCLDYLLSLSFFLFFPVPERWTNPDSGAILLSDEWSSELIKAIRPISGLDNSFPSFHVSLTVVIILTCFLFKIRFRTTALVLGSTIILSTFILGIHWAPDILAGLALGVLSVFLARRLDPSTSASELQRVQ